MKKWLVLLTALIILSLVVDLLSFNVLYNLAENKVGLRGELAEITPIGPIEYLEGLDTTDLGDEALECVADNCDSELGCINFGYGIMDECIDNCKETKDRQNWMFAAVQYCLSLYGANATQPLDLVKFNECLAPYVVEFRKALENTPGYFTYETCLIDCEDRGADSQNNCLRGRSICIAECDEMYPNSYPEEPYDPNDPVPTPAKPKWPWSYREYAYDSDSSSYYSS
ncbi:MAG: hypothetical protein Q8N63_05785 [Nanoarchaeota archaeon]|nr:hypothetical protein [Nanoarchaeota archaeon]